MGMNTQQLKQGVKKAGFLGVALGFGFDLMNVGSAIGTYKASQDEGDHIAISALKGAGNFAISEAFYGAMSATKFGFVGGLAGNFAMGAIQTGANLLAQRWQGTGRDMSEAYNQATGLGSGHFDMTQAGYTMRQRSLNAIRSNGANINSAFGNEARNYYLGL